MTGELTPRFTPTVLVEHLTIDEIASILSRVPSAVIAHSWRDCRSMLSWLERARPSATLTTGQAEIRWPEGSRTMGIRFMDDWGVRGMRFEAIWVATSITDLQILKWDECMRSMLDGTGRMLRAGPPG